MAVQLTFVSHSEAATDEFAALCARSLNCGLTIALNGQLGSGKTRFVRAFCEALGIDPSLVTSPTFVLMQLYQSDRWTVSHFDTYRLGDVDEFLALGAEEYLADPDNVCLIEWADRIAELLPHDHVTLSIQQTGATQRTFELSADGPVSDELVRRVAELLRDR